MTRLFVRAAIPFTAALLLIGSAMAQTYPAEQKILSLLNDSNAAYVALSESEFCALGVGFDLPDGGRTMTDLAQKAPDGAFDR